MFEEQKLQKEQVLENQAARDDAINNFVEAEKAVQALENNTEAPARTPRTFTVEHSELETARAKKMSALQKIEGETTMKLTFTLPEEEAKGLRKQLQKPNEVGFQEVKPS